MKRYSHTPKHPDLIAGLADASALRSIVDCLERNLDDLSMQDARKAAMDSITTLNAAIRELTP
jgi:hypothetical protein